MAVAWQDLPSVDALKNGEKRKRKRQYCELALTVIEAVPLVRGNEVINPPSNSSDSRPPAARASDTLSVGILLLH